MACSDETPESESPAGNQEFLAADRKPEIIGVVTGLQAEAELVRSLAESDAPDHDVRVMCLGPGPHMAGEAARRLLTVGVTRLASFGLAGGLKMSLWPGTAIVARKVIGAGGTHYPTDADWHARLIGGLIGDDEVVDGDLVEATDPVTTVADKRKLYESSQAGAVDMESAAVAAEAARADKPFIALRAIADPADRGIPPTALTALRADGTTSSMRAVSRAVARPQDIIPLVRLGLDSRAAFATLRRVLARTGALTGAPLATRLRMRRRQKI